MLEIAHTSFSDRLLIALLGLVVAVALGGPLKLYQKLNLSHPVMFIHLITLKLEQKLNRRKRSSKERRIRGFIFLLFMAGLAIILAHWVGTLIWLYHFQLINIAIVAFLLPVRELFDRTLYLLRHLQKHDLEESRELAAAFARKQAAAMDEHTIARTAIEHLSESFADKVIAPIFWYLLLGLPGLFASKLINVLDGLVGHRSERFAAFGMASALADDISNLIPARLGGFFLVAAAIFVPGCRPLQAFRIMWRDADKLASPNGGWPIAATAGALHLSLAGPRAAGGAFIEDKWVGIGSAKASAVDVKRALLLYAMSVGLLILSIAALLYI